MLAAEKYMTAKVVKLESGEWSFSSLVPESGSGGDGDDLRSSALNKRKDGDIHDSKHLGG